MNPQMEPQPATVPMVTPPSVITSINNEFHVDTPKILDQSLSRLPAKSPQGSGLTAGSGNTAPAAAMGSSVPSAAPATSCRVPSMI